jgi:hypothetical protein
MTDKKAVRNATETSSRSSAEIIPLDRDWETDAKAEAPKGEDW